MVKSVLMICCSTGVWIYKAAFVYTTAAHNLHVELHQLQGGKKRMRDPWPSSSLLKTRYETDLDRLLYSLWVFDLVPVLTPL